MIVQRYRDADAPTWDAFVRASRNGTFLFERGYMDYHRDRFADHSLLVRDPEGELVAILPAHAAGDEIFSHRGLSHGGLVIGPGMKTPAYLDAFESVLGHLRSAGFAGMEYKTVPAIYHRQPADEDKYALFLLGATVSRRDLLAVVAREERLSYQSRRARGMKKARLLGVRVGEELDFAAFWDVLATTLAERFDSAPVHTLAEIQMLRQRFPTNIRLFTARGSGLVAGVVVYESARVAHCQYIAASPAGRDVGALDLLFDHLLTTVYRDHAYFDFGGSHEGAGRAVNRGLIEQKEGFGARGVAHDQYRIDLNAIRPGVLTGALR